MNLLVWAKSMSVGTAIPARVDSRPFLEQFLAALQGVDDDNRCSGEGNFNVNNIVACER